MDKTKFFLKAAISSVIFIFFITGFATLYTFQLDKHFLFSTAELEPSYQNTIEKSLNVLRDDIFGEFNKEPGNEHRGFARIKGDTVLIASIKESLNNEEVFIEFSNKEKNVVFYSIDGYNTPDSGSPPKSDTLYTDFFGTCRAFIASFSGKTASKGDNYLSCDFENRDGNVLRNVQLRKVISKEKLDFNNILHPEQGINDGLFYRMLYFSAVTATTLGYGEILPLTNTARFWVAIESITGLLLMGGLVFWITKKEKPANHSCQTDMVQKTEHHHESNQIAGNLKKGVPDTTVE